MSRSTTPDPQETQSEEELPSTSKWKQSVSSICDLPMDDNEKNSTPVLQEPEEAITPDTTEARAKLMVLNEDMFNNLSDQLKLNYETKVQNIPQSLSHDLKLKIKTELADWKTVTSEAIYRAKETNKENITNEKLTLKEIGTQMITAFHSVVNNLT